VAATPVASSYSISPLAPTVNEKQGTETFTITRLGTSQGSTVYVSTVQDQTHESGGEHASARLAIKYLEPHSRLSFSDVA
jgi:hypothetical protein